MQGKFVSSQSRSTVLVHVFIALAPLRISLDLSQQVQPFALPQDSKRVQPFYRTFTVTFVAPAPTCTGCVWILRKLIFSFHAFSV